MPSFLDNRKTPGDPLHIDAATWNALIEAARRVLGPAFDGLAGAGYRSPISPLVTVLVRNDLGASAGIRAVYRLGDPIIDPDAEPLAVQGRPAFEGLEPTAFDNAIAIGLEPAADGKLIRAAVSGVVVAEVNVADVDHQYCGPVSADSAKLKSRQYGPARLLGHNGATGVQSCAVLLAPVRDAACGLLMGKLDGAMAYQGSATMSVWAWDGAADSDTTENVTVYDWLLSSGDTVASGARVVAAYVGGRWRVIGAEC